MEPAKALRMGPCWKEMIQSIGESRNKDLSQMEQMRNTGEELSPHDELKGWQNNSTTKSTEINTEYCTWESFVSWAMQKRTREPVYWLGILCSNWRHHIVIHQLPNLQKLKSRRKNLHLVAHQNGIWRPTIWTSNLSHNKCIWFRLMMQLLFYSRNRKICRLLETWISDGGTEIPWNTVDSWTMAKVTLQMFLICPVRGMLIICASQVACGFLACQ